MSADTRQTPIYASIMSIAESHSRKQLFPEILKEMWCLKQALVKKELNAVKAILHVPGISRYPEPGYVGMWKETLHKRGSHTQQGHNNSKLAYLWSDTHATRDVHTKDDKRFITARRTAGCCRQGWLHQKRDIVRWWLFLFFNVDDVTMVAKLTVPHLAEKWKKK